jgi:L-alanine-DL-glutamate epimerase-like enolase superfamily enzyme
MIVLKAARLHRLQLRARMPFRYGIATMTEVPHVILRLTFEIGGRVVEGLSADHLPPKWFTKDPNRALPDEIEEMLLVIRTAVEGARAVRARTPFQFWRELYAVQGAWGAANKIPPLLAQFGTTLVERALIDATCRLEGVPFARALRENRFGIELGALHGGLAGSTPAAWLPAAPADRVFVRHTVGLSDPIEEADIVPGERVDDGLPQSLDSCIRFYGLRHFKIKVDADGERARDRLRRIAAVLSRECREGFAFSLDGNESFKDPQAFTALVRSLLAEPGLATFWPGLLFIEQPLHRDVALTEASGWAGWPGRPPIIIDESDAEIGSLPRALGLGYAGTSHKNCKGVFKGVANACLLAHRRASGLPAMLSGEDLTNVGPVALLQDLAVQAVLGVSSVERNGHHYFAGLSQFPREIQDHILARHGDLYARTAAGRPRLDVRGGEVRLGSLLAAPFGCAVGLPLGELLEG